LDRIYFAYENDDMKTAWSITEPPGAQQRAATRSYPPALRRLPSAACLADPVRPRSLPNTGYAYYAFYFDVFSFSLASLYSNIYVCNQCNKNRNMQL
jgi:hypothetical protein